MNISCSGSHLSFDILGYIEQLNSDDGYDRVLIYLELVNEQHGEKNNAGGACSLDQEGQLL